MSESQADRKHRAGPRTGPSRGRSTHTVLSIGTHKHFASLLTTMEESHFSPGRDPFKILCAWTVSVSFVQKSGGDPDSPTHWCSRVDNSCSLDMRFSEPLRAGYPHFTNYPPEHQGCQNPLRTSKYTRLQRIK